MCVDYDYPLCIYFVHKLINLPLLLCHCHKFICRVVLLFLFFVVVCCDWCITLVYESYARLFMKAEHSLKDIQTKPCATHCCKVHGSTM